MKRGWWLLLILGAGLLAWWRWGASRPGTAPPPVAAVAVPENAAGRAGDVRVSQEAMQLAEIRVAPVELRTVRDRLSVSGSIQSGGDQTARVTPKVAGKVVRILVDVGDSVQPGQTLAVLESAELAAVQADYRQALAESRARASDLARQRELARLGQFGQPRLEESRTRALDDQRGVQQARRQLEEQRAAVRQAEAERQVRAARVARDRELQELVSRQERERDLADEQKALAEVAAARARLRGAQAELGLVEKRAAVTSGSLAREEKVYSGQFLTSRELVESQTAAELADVRLQAAADRLRLLGGAPGESDRVLLVSPIRGRVTEQSVTLGETVPVEKAAFTVVNLDKVWARLAMAPQEAGKAAPGDVVELTSEAAPGQLFRGRVAAVDAGSDETTRAVYVRVPLANPRGLLKTGTFVQGSLVTAVREQKVTVPDAALQEHNGRPTLYVARQPGEFEVRHVLLGARGEHWREVTQGLKAGETIAVQGTFYLKSEALKSSLSDGCCAGD